MGVRASLIEIKQRKGKREMFCFLQSPSFDVPCFVGFAQSVDASSPLYAYNIVTIHNFPKMKP